MHVQDIMTKDPVACDVGDSLRHAARLMKDKNVGCVVALRDGRLAGMLTDRDICLAFADEKEHDTVEDLMTTELGRLHPDDSVFHAVDTFRSAGVVRRLPVINHRDELVGLLSISDLAVVADALNKAIYLQETHQSLDEAHILTGGKEIIKVIRRPSKEDRIPRKEVSPAQPAHTGPPAKSGRGSA